MKNILNIIWSFIKNNLLIITIAVLLVVAAPQAFGPIVGAVLAVIGVFMLLILLGVGAIYFHFRKMRRKVEEQFRQAQGGGAYGGQQGREQRSEQRREGDVTVVDGRPQQQRVSDDVGEYVDFKEIKE